MTPDAPGDVPEFDYLWCIRGAHTPHQHLSHAKHATTLDATTGILGCASVPE